MFKKRIVIFANGELPDKEKARAILHDDDFIIAADGGTRHALALGKTPDIIIGDLDSLPSTFSLQTFNGEMLQHPRDKNETDLELAIEHALTLNPEQVIIIAALGGRLDQTIGNITLLLRPSSTVLRLDDGNEEVFFCHNKCQVNGKIGDIVSLIPWQGEVTGIVTSGLKWPLQSETLYPHQTRGISNELIEETAAIQIKNGKLLIVHRRTD